MKHLPIPLRLLRYALPYKKRILFVWVVVAGLSTFQLLGPWLVARAIDTGLPHTGSDVHGSLRTLAFAAVLITLAAVFRGMFQYAQTYTAEWLSQHVAYDI